MVKMLHALAHDQTGLYGSLKKKKKNHNTKKHQLNKPAM